MEKKLRLKKFVMPLVYVVLVLLVVFSTFMTFANINELEDEVEEINYVSDNILIDDIPVISEQKTIIKPFKEEKVVIGKYYYDYSDNADSQQNSIIFFENSYIQNSGVDYIHEKIFEVVAVYDGIVIKTEDNEITGKTIEIKHDNNVISIYQGLSEIKVKQGDKINQATIIGKSGVSKINEALGNHLHFEMYVNGQVINPEECYDKKINEF